MLVDIKNNKPTPKTRSVCGCGGALVSRCGKIKIWHWAHLPGESKDTWHEPETEWHIRMKTDFTETIKGSFSEVRIEKNGVLHIADFAYGENVIEFQHSHISKEEIKERESFYGNMKWFIDLKKNEGKKQKPVDFFNKKQRKIFSIRLYNFDCSCIFDSFNMPKIPKMFLFSNKPIIFDIEDLRFVSIKRKWDYKYKVLKSVGFIGETNNNEFKRYIATTNNASLILEADQENIE